MASIQLGHVYRKLNTTSGLIGVGDWFDDDADARPRLPLLCVRRTGKWMQLTGLYLKGLVSRRCAVSPMRSGT
jgi:hypothetical protein